MKQNDGNKEEQWWGDGIVFRIWCSTVLLMYFSLKIHLLLDLKVGSKINYHVSTRAISHGTIGHGAKKLTSYNHDESPFDFAFLGDLYCRILTIIGFFVLFSRECPTGISIKKNHVRNYLDRHTITTLVMKFLRTGSVVDDVSRRCLPKTAKTDENAEWTPQRFQRSPTKSLRKATQQTRLHGLECSSIHWWSMKKLSFLHTLLP